MRRAQHEARAVHALFQDIRADIGLVIQPETQHFAAASQSAEETGERVVGIDHRHAVGRQCAIQRALGFGHHFDRTHPLKMRGRDEIDEADIGPCDGSEIIDVAGLAGTHFEHGVFGIFRHPQQGQRQADFIVVAAGIDVGAAMTATGSPP